MNREICCPAVGYYVHGILVQIPAADRDNRVPFVTSILVVVAAVELHACATTVPLICDVFHAATVLGEGLFRLLCLLFCFLLLSVVLVNERRETGCYSASKEGQRGMRRRFT